ARARPPPAGPPCGARRSAPRGRSDPETEQPAAGRSPRVRNEHALRPRRDERVRRGGRLERPEHLAEGIQVRLQVGPLDPQHGPAADQPLYPAEMALDVGQPTLAVKLIARPPRPDGLPHFVE